MCRLQEGEGACRLLFSVILPLPHSLPLFSHRERNPPMIPSIKHQQSSNEIFTHLCNPNRRNHKNNNKVIHSASMTRNQFSSRSPPPRSPEPFLYSSCVRFNR